MDPMGEEFLAGAGFTGDEDGRRIGLGGLLLDVSAVPFEATG